MQENFPALIWGGARRAQDTEIAAKSLDVKNALCIVVYSMYNYSMSRTL